MDSLLETAAVLVLLTDLALLGANRVRLSINVLAVQGLIVGVLPLILKPGLEGEHLSTVLLTIAIRAVLFPWLLLRAQRAASVPGGIDGVVGTPVALLLGVALAAYAAWLAPTFPASSAFGSADILHAALTTVFVGLALLVLRRRALSQVVGYVALENGIYALGVGLGVAETLIVELGILLDVFVAVFVMGITIHHIRNEFDRIDVDDLTELRG